jgi:transcription elongation factor GreA
MVEKDNTVFMTERGIQKARKELETLINTSRPELLDYIQDARDGGDSDDNTEFSYLSQELENISRRIRDLEYMLDHAQLIERVGSNETIVLGSTVVIQENVSVPETYTIVGSVEADPADGSISNQSPLGKALLDHRIGDEVAVDSPDGELRFRIVAIH